MTTTSEQQTLSQRVSQELTNALMGLFDLVVNERKEHYRLHPVDRPTLKKLSQIKKSYAQKNALISGGANIIPGPLGFLALVPEIAVVTRNQLAMICDIGAAYGKEDVLSKELLAGVFASAMGASLGSLMMMHGSKVVVKRSSLRVFQKVVTVLAGHITQRALKATIGKLLPVVGAAALAGWSYLTTSRIADKAIQIFEKDILIDDTEVTIEAAVSLLPQADQQSQLQNFENDTQPYSRDAEIEKIHLMINLMCCDGKIDTKELFFILKTIHTLADGQQLSREERSHLVDLANEGQPIAVDYSKLRGLSDQGLEIVVSLILLAKKDGEFHDVERQFIQRAAQAIDFPNSDLEALVA